MSDLSGFTDEEIELEMAKRKRAAEEQSIPVPKPNPDFKELINACRSHISDIARTEHDDDTEHYIYEAAIEAVYGDEVWKWINKRI